MQEAQRVLWRLWLGAALLLAGVAVVALGPGLAEAPALILGAWLAAGLGWCGVLWGASTWFPSRTKAVLVVLLGGVLLRLVAWSGAPALSDDLWRYAFEGGLVLEGQSPYAEAPIQAGTHLPASAWPELIARINHAQISAAYPPLTQLVHAAAVAASGGSAGLVGPECGRAALGLLRAIYGLCDLACAVLWCVWLLRRGRSPLLALAWAWSPLAALEYAGAGHFDALGLALMVGGLVALDAPRAARFAPALLVLGGLVKLLPLVLVPFALRELQQRAGWRACALGGALAAAVGLACCLPLLLLAGAGQAEFAGLSAYSLKWEGFNLVYRWIEALAGAFGDLDEGWSDPRRIGRTAVALLWLGVALWAWLRRWSALESAGLLMALFVLLVPTLHPWYLGWALCLAPALPLRGWRGRSLLLCAALLPLSYQPLVGWIAAGEWREADWLWPVLALPVLATAAFEFALLQRNRQG